MKKKPKDSDMLNFTASNSGNFFLSSSNEKLYQQLSSGFRDGKILFTLTGDPGLGKSFLTERVINELEASTQLIKIPYSNIEYNEFLNLIAKESGIDLSNESTLTEKIANLTRCIWKQPYKHFIIEVDQAHKIKPDTLEALLNWVKLIKSEQRSTPFIHIILIGLPTLDTLLNKSELQKLGQKIICQVYITPLDENEILDYIDFHLIQTEEDTERFDADALKRIISFSKGNPGLINKLCDLGLLSASLDKKTKVTASEIDEAAENCLIKFTNELSPGTEPAVQEKTILENMDPDATVIPPTKVRKNKETMLNQLLSGTYQNNAIIQNNPATEQNTYKPSIIESSPNKKRPDNVLANPEKTRPISDITRRNFSSDPYFQKVANKSQNEEISSPTLFDETQHIGDQTLIEEVKPNSERTIRLSKQSQPTYPTPEKKPKSFVTGLVLGILCSIGVLFVLQQNWLEKLQWTLDSPNPKATHSQPELPSDSIQIIQPSEPLATVELDENQQPDEIALPELDIIQETEQVTDTSVAQETAIIEPEKPDGLNLQIDQLHNQANRQMDNKQLMTPADDNAWQTYQEILKLAPDNEQALAGIDKIAITYSLWAREEIKKGNSVHAEYLFKKSLEVSPNNQEALSGLDQVNDKQNSTIEKPTDQNTENIRQDQKDPQIEELLRLAQKLVEIKQLMSPADANALDTYKEILSIDPGNEKALTGIENIAMTYILWANEEIENGNFQHAGYLYNQALIVSPGNKDALFGLDRLRLMP